MTTPDEARQAGREVAQLLVDALFETGDVGAAIELAQRRLVLRELEPPEDE